MALGKCIDDIANDGVLAGQGSPPHFWPTKVQDSSLCRIDRAGYAGANVSGTTILLYSFTR